MYIVLENFLGLKLKWQYVIAVMLITVNIPYYIINRLNIESIYQWIPEIIYFFLFAVIFCTGTHAKKLIITIFYICLDELTQYITVPLLVMIPDFASQKILNELMMIGYRLVYIFILIFILKKYTVNNGFKNKGYMVSFAVPNLFIVYLMCEYFKIYYNDSRFHTALLGNIKMLGIALLSLICLVFTVIILNKLAEEGELKNRQALLAQHFNMQSDHYRYLQLQYEKTRAFKHDINNHLICIKNLMAEGDMNDAKKYLEKMTHALDKLNVKVNTGNPFADAVISEKCNNMLEKNIEFSCNLNLSESINIDPLDLCVILGNALDNAIEACSKITDDKIKKYIYLKSTMSKSFIVFEAENSMQGYIKNRSIHTDKKDSSSHGFGLLNIKGVAEKYSGGVYTKNSVNKFSLNIMLQTT
ncbi:hypothetical protein CLORY_15640 [Clostridium oryzae]|uniref:Sensor histidine kinase NatK-like C-terminal domain-containing protein n=2 Tax=Clostridium oryzae TaxID=1450648 RepID=A0A1V4ISZ1_9CLOT|nr:hypothetical protein CLORY_15640 [Clostridium oryzae]